MVAAAVAAVELFILIVVAVIFGAKLVTNHAEKATSPAAIRAIVQSETTKPAAATPAKGTTKAPAVANLPRSRTSIIVLNGNGTPGAAATVADRLSRFHYIVAATGNAPRSDFRRSVVMYRTAAFRGEALRLANDLHLRRVAPLDGMTRRDLQGAHLALIIGG
jgi:LytR cell envelope-related transcriptional attenuator